MQTQGHLDWHLQTLAQHLSFVFIQEHIAFSYAIIPNAKSELQKYSLYPEELIYLNELQPIRQAEFIMGRYCARRAAQRLNMQLEAIIWDARGVPQWPANITGSISHKWRLCAAAIARKEDFTSIGLDIERNELLRTDLWNLYCTERELDLVKKHQNPCQMVNLLFCIKEAVYKCLFPIHRIEFGFTDLEVSLWPAQGHFRAVLSSSCRGSDGSGVVDGRYSLDSHWIVASSSISHSKSK